MVFIPKSKDNAHLPVFMHDSDGLNRKLAAVGYFCLFGLGFSTSNKKSSTQTKICSPIKIGSHVINAPSNVSVIG